MEVAAFRIASEAVTNSARHSGSDRVRVDIGREGELLEVRVSDAGTGGVDWVPGVGLSSMRERAAEVGGTLHLSAQEGAPTVRALLPLG